MTIWETYNPDNDPPEDWYSWDHEGQTDAEMDRYKLDGLVNWFD